MLLKSNIVQSYIFCDFTELSIQALKSYSLLFGIKIKIHAFV